MWEFIKRVWRAAGAAVSVAERLWQIIVGLLGFTGAAVMAWLTQTWDWYWLTFSWAGTAIAFLVSYLLLSVGALLFSVSAAIYARRNTREKILEDPSGPLIWSMSPTINGPLHNPYAIIIRGNNISTTGVVLRESYILSSITGKRIDMMICAVDSEGATHVVGVDEINPVPPGARLEMVAHVGGTPNTGYPSDVFLKDWGRFRFFAADSTRTYYVDFGEAIMAVFYPGQVGPRVTLKAK